MPFSELYNDELISISLNRWENFCVMVKEWVNVKFKLNKVKLISVAFLCRSTPHRGSSAWNWKRRRLTSQVIELK